jgi:hypothetical protein
MFLVHEAPSHIVGVDEQLLTAELKQHQPVHDTSPLGENQRPRRSRPAVDVRSSVVCATAASREIPDVILSNCCDRPIR